MNERLSTEPGDTARRIAAALAAAAEETRVADVRIGLGYTAVMLADGRAGVAFTFRDQAAGGCSVFNGIRPLAGRPASDLLALLNSRDVIEGGVGLACANALANRESGRLLDGDVLEHLDLRPEDHVAMIGYFHPLVAKIKTRARALTVFERVDRPTELLRPQEEALTELRRCQVALITATAIINRTIDPLLEAAGECREVALLGASTPLLTSAFEDANVTLLSGVVVQNPPEILRVVSEGGGMRFFGPYIRKVSVRTASASGYAQENRS